MDREALGNVAEILLDYVEQDRTYQSDKIVTIPSSAYTDPAIWQREMELIFKRVPLMLAASAELPEPGNYKAMDAMGLPILITRDREGRARAFFNVCSHRGSQVVPDGHGKQARFSCIYHGWTFGNDGGLIGVSDRQKFGEIDKSQRGLRELPCEEKAGLIFAVLTPGEPMDLADFTAGMLDDFETLDFKDWAFLGSRVIYGANWKIAFDGYLEGYHFSQLHPTTIHPRTPSNVTHYEAFGPHLRIGFPQVGIGEKLREFPRESWGERENQGFDFVRIIFPNISAFVAPEITQIAQLFPGPTPAENRTVLSFFRREGARDGEDAAAIESMIDWLRDVVDQEDYQIGLSVQKGIKSGAHESIILGRNERGNQFFHEYVAWYLANDPAVPKPVL